MSKKRKQYSASFKSKVALAALKGDQTTSEIAARFQIHPTMVSTWKRELLENAPDLFESENAAKCRDRHCQERKPINRVPRLPLQS
ncbi:transposase [Marinobacter bryozoorum]|uniref:transposase n=1 Tax=Marinobacter bryozoorum TaxID=256324 RepID=UPI002003C0E9|nr:transposase [Marinobacter bryozoorum]MCK7544636.1 transposase [Marinobacter bryozoorum]